MQLITDNYQKLNETLHNNDKSYGTCGNQHSDTILKIAHSLNTKDILDYGCGKCMLANTLPFPIKNYDPCIRAFADEPDPAEIVVCTDVMEHIEPDLCDNVLKHIRSKTKNVAFFSINTFAAAKTLEDGRNAHINLHDGVWWFNKISEHFEILSFMITGSNIDIYAKTIIKILRNEINIGK